MQNNSKVYDIQFWFLCLSSFLFFASFNMIIPELPAYLSSMGGAEYKGLIIALFTLTAGLSRPFSGKLADKIGRIPVMVVGALVCIVCGFFYPIINSVSALLLLRFLHGFSTGFTPTGTSAYVADLIPATRRGEAMGLIGISGNTGMAMGPAIGSFITAGYSLDMMFYASSLFAMLSVLIIGGMKETLKHKESFRLQLLAISRKEIIESRVIPPGIVVFLTYFSYGAVLTIIPDFSVHLGILNKGLFFTVFTISSLGIRLVAGKVSDKHGRVVVLKVSSLVMVLAMLLIGMAESSVSFFVAAALFGIGVGMGSPTINAWTIDLSHPEHRGRAMATMYISLEAGIGLGALLSSWVYDNNAAMFPYAFWSSGVLCFAAFVYLMVYHRKRQMQLVR